MDDNDWFYERREQIRKKLDDTRKKQEEARRIELKNKGIEPYEWNNDFHKYHDSIYTMDNDSATILYAIVMFIGSIFNDRLIIWIVATIVYYLHITRHHRKK
jgi:hypothetical protein